MSKHDKDTSTSKPKAGDVPLTGKVVLIGSGVIGRNWAVLFARGGFDVVLYDIKKNEQLEEAMKDIKESKLRLLEQYNMLGKNGSTKDLLDRISVSTNLKDALCNAIFVQEGVPENVTLKQNVFEEVDKLLYELSQTKKGDMATKQQWNALYRVLLPPLFHRSSAAIE
ncbi:crystallin, lambda 1 [Reticulomyxa filosa]|uniref:Crystallin, lambda 1 n=1 Tax=Reticulomyxa filosa TaxID=46433 RepID=X6P491_RETFI|nr:crystallin, lambda 1 [Reticulomyxa filosa]|eukprot:ETO32938.1 crystallin, lambda 1 [Reticulomyxa filosa]